MPIKIPDALPAHETLLRENIASIFEQRAVHQDIRPLRIVILNLMPTKVITETQLLRLLGNSPLQVEIELMQTASYTPRNTSQKHLLTFYKTFEQIKDQFFDGMIITGAPIETMEFEDVAYWDELCAILDWTQTHVHSCFFICWGAQAALYHFYGIGKHACDGKMLGIFPHYVHEPQNPIMRGFDDVFFAPHSRYTEVREADVRQNGRIHVLATSPVAGLYLACSPDLRHVFCTGHSEYDRDTLAAEYKRDQQKGIDTGVPFNYFINDDPESTPLITWRAHGNLLFQNWLNTVYQQTPFDLRELL